MKNILVTGGASFIGSHLVERLVEDNNNVSIIDDLSSGKQIFLQKVIKDIEFFRFNIKDNPLKVRSIFKDIDIVFHLANLHGGRNWIHYHPALCCTNASIDNLVFENAVKAGVNHVQFCSSACVYPLKYQQNNNYEKLREGFVNYNDLTSADEEYGLMKLTGEISLHAHMREFGLKGSIVRLSSIYGPRENETHAVMALIAKAFVKQDPYEVFSDGTQVRNFTYVDDIVDCMVRASEKISDCTPINLGTEESVTVNELVDMIFTQMRWKPNKVFHDMSKPAGAHSRVVSNQKAHELLGFKEWTSIYDGVKKTIEWYTQTYDEPKIRRKLEVLLRER